MKSRISVTMEPMLIRWLDRKVKEKTFASRSHGLEYLVKRRIEVESR